MAENNRRSGKSQEPWEDNQWCECKCPCQPGIDVDKWVWIEGLEGWANEVPAEVGQTVRFRIEIENDGECRDIIDVMAIDLLPGCLDYAGDADIYLNGQRYGSGSPDQMRSVSGGLELGWNLEDLGAISPGDVIAIEYDAVAEEPGINLNLFSAEAHCAYEYDNIVTDQDTAAVLVSPEEPEIPPVTETLYAYLEWHAESWYDPPFCESFFDVYFEAEDLSGGIYPVTRVILYVDGDIWHDTGNISTGYYDGSVSGDALCGDTIEIELVAMNLAGQTLTVSDTMTMPTP